MNTHDMLFFFCSSNISASQNVKLLIVIGLICLMVSVITTIRKYKKKFENPPADVSFKLAYELVFGNRIFLSQSKEFFDQDDRDILFRARIFNIILFGLLCLTIKGILFILQRYFLTCV